MEDERPNDIKELSRLVAIKLRRRGIRALASQSGNGVEIIRSGASNFYYYDLCGKEAWSTMGPLGMALEIQTLEAQRAAEWAGDS